MTSKEIRNTFLEFFRSQGHQIVPSAPMVIKNDPTLMFTNAGMNQFKDIFLGNVSPKNKRVADTQKCLRVSGKHNDLEEVGIDTYHHTMFEMLGNWSFGDYFKKEAIEWAWQLLTDVYKLPKDRLYVTVFEGDKKEKLNFDQDAFDFWKQHIAEDRILKGNKKDNFWEMGDTGPCGPCSEIHIDLRSEAERKTSDGKALVNTSHPQVIEIWNLVFMEFNRKADSSLEPLPAKHVDTGMGFERLCMAMQGKTSNYDTDVFQPLIQFISSRSGIKYGVDNKDDIAMRVMADHIRAITCAIADGQLPSNNKAGYVIRRILRRAVRYGFTFLNFKEPFLNKLVPILAEQFKDVFPEIIAQQEFIQKVIFEEEAAFLRTLAAGIIKFNSYKHNHIEDEIYNFLTVRGLNVSKNYLIEDFVFDLFINDKKLGIEIGSNKVDAHVHREVFRHGTVRKLPDLDRVNYKLIFLDEVIKNGYKFDFIDQKFETNNMIDAQFAFELYDTYGFPIDLTQLMARENDMTVDINGFNKCLGQQKERSRAAAQVDTEDWINVKDGDEVEFVGYDELECDCEIIKYRKVKAKGKEQYQIVLNKTPFYAESGGQVGDTGVLIGDGEKIFITGTQKENNLIVHYALYLPKNLNGTFHAVVDKERRKLIMAHHSATHLMHSALKQVLGKHVNQKGSLVNDQVTRFDFSHFAKVTEEEIEKIQHLVNEKIREDIVLDEKRNVPIKEAMEMGATALFGEKYGDFVRVITFDPNYSRELCGGTHVKATGQIGSFKIVSESAVAAGVRRVEAIVADRVEEYMKQQGQELNAVKEILNNPKDAAEKIQQLLYENASLQQKLEEFNAAKAQLVKKDLLTKIIDVNGIKLIAEKIDLGNADAIKNISFELKNQVENLFFLAGAEIDGKAHLSLIISDGLVKEKKLNASNIIREIAKEIQGGGGGQPFYATAGGKNPKGIAAALEKGKSFV
jgi:alanyl-tRNA synthetase